MPSGTLVDKIYKALRRKGMNKGKAARIAQSKSGEALATGKPPVHHNMAAEGDDTHHGHSIKLSPQDWLDGLCEAMGVDCHEHSHAAAGGHR